MVLISRFFFNWKQELRNTYRMPALVAPRERRINGHFLLLLRICNMEYKDKMHKNKFRIGNEAVNVKSIADGSHRTDILLVFENFENVGSASVRKKIRAAEYDRQISIDYIPSPADVQQRLRYIFLVESIDSYISAILIWNFTDFVRFAIVIW